MIGVCPLPWRSRAEPLLHTSPRLLRTQRQRIKSAWRINLKHIIHRLWKYLRRWIQDTRFFSRLNQTSHANNEKIVSKWVSESVGFNVPTTHYSLHVGHFGDESSSQSLALVQEYTEVPGEAISWHRMQGNPSAAGAPPLTLLGELIVLPQAP